jgi:hypothetical protein
LSFDVTRPRDHARVLDLDAASLDRRIPEARASMASANTAKARLTDLRDIQEGRSIADMLASTRPPTRSDSPFLRVSTSISAPDTLLGAVRTDESYARRISTFADSSLVKTVTKLGSLAVREPATYRNPEQRHQSRNAGHLF